ncbi:hypothetical protein B9J07_27550 [Sinorhizobium sp. LM21]|uniref:hypothetical protein n=1 Tax=Sinorhizobium sp. LM21 TaxID=1449788 RepID=UPI0005D9A269|nr:hypothetical protein [Sinorhizobium sp. LM21]AJW30248.1 hypothetical protein pLM21S1_p130 [Sinorhizobium sp. LM21]OWZ90347.1 hypothetical protein B9J07_27550 [Sinorhizobium sp. LM21]
MLFCKVLAEYSLSFDELMNLSIRRFWFIANMIERLRAEKDLRQIQLMASVGSPEAYKSAREFLQEQMGQIYVLDAPEAPVEFKVDPKTGLDPEFDREGLRALKMRISSGR